MWVRLSSLTGRPGKAVRDVGQAFQPDQTAWKGRPTYSTQFSVDSQCGSGFPAGPDGLERPSYVFKQFSIDLRCGSGFPAGPDGLERPSYVLNAILWRFAMWVRLSGRTGRPGKAVRDVGQAFQPDRTAWKGRPRCGSSFPAGPDGLERPSYVLFGLRRWLPAQPIRRLRLRGG